MGREETQPCNDLSFNLFQNTINHVLNHSVPCAGESSVSTTILKPDMPEIRHYFNMLLKTNQFYCLPFVSKDLLQTNRYEDYILF